MPEIETIKKELLFLEKIRDDINMRIDDLESYIERLKYQERRGAE